MSRRLQNKAPPPKKNLGENIGKGKGLEKTFSLKTLYKWHSVMSEMVDIVDY